MFAIGFRWLYKLSQQKDPPRVLDLAADQIQDLDQPRGEAVVPR